jgi:hypothetical protein
LGRQRYRCHDCGKLFSTPKTPLSWVSRAYKDYSAGRQTLNDLARRYGYSLRTIQRHFDAYKPPSSPIAVAQEPVALTFDGTFFGRGYGLMIYRASGRNIFWQEIESETLAVMEQGLRHLTAQGWRFSSITIDGRQGTVSLIKRLFPKVAIQLCIFHQKATIQRYLTSKPKTPCGKEIRALMSFLLFIDDPLFLACLEGIKEDHKDFLKERNEQGQFKHRKIRSALRSLTTNAAYLYTWQRHPELKIPTTTNSCDGSFAHWKNKIKIHRGLRKHRRTKMILELLKNN